MSEINSFSEIRELIDDAEKIFSTHDLAEFQDLEEVVALVFLTMRSISRFYSSEEWKDSKHEYVLAVLIQATETVFGMYALSRSGFWDNALVLKRNFSELLSVAIAIGYDSQCFIDWKHDRDNMKEFSKVYRRVKDSELVPESEKEFLEILKKYWYESSQRYSHNISVDTIRTLVKEGQIKFEPKTATPDFEVRRLRTLRNMLINIQNILLGIFDYGRFTEERKEQFLEAPNIIKRSNIIFNNEEWKRQSTL